MDWNNAVTLARQLMDEHGFRDVPLVAHNRKREFGTTSFRRVLVKTVTDSWGRSRHEYSPWLLEHIALSKPLVALNSEADVRDTILHEIAHAKVGPEAKHSFQWKICARQVGANPDAHCGEGVKVPTGAYIADCTCGQNHTMYRMPTRTKVCRTTRQRLTFRKVDTV